MRLCALSLVSVFSSSVRGGGGGADGGGSGHSFSRIRSTYEAICASVGFILLRKEFTFLEKQQDIRRRFADRLRAAGSGANLLFQDGHDGFQNGIKDIQKDGVSCSHKPAISFKSHLMHLLTLKHCRVKPKINIPCSHSRWKTTFMGCLRLIAAGIINQNEGNLVSTKVIGF